jgi:hypothetical protein
MITLDNKVRPQVAATAVSFQDQNLILSLSDGRTLTLPLTKYEWLKWLAQATPEQREHWTIEPGGYAVYWQDLDDGIEIEHVLSLYALS